MVWKFWFRNSRVFCDCHHHLHRYGMMTDMYQLISISIVTYRPSHRRQARTQKHQSMESDDCIELNLSGFVNNKKSKILYYNIIITTKIQVASKLGKHWHSTILQFRLIFKGFYKSMVFPEVKGLTMELLIEITPLRTYKTTLLFLNLTEPINYE